MEHSARAIEKRQISNEQVAYRIVCCGEKCCTFEEQGCREVAGHICCKPSAHTCEDSWHTMSIHIEDHDSELQPIIEAVAARHQKMKAWRAK